MSRIVGGVPVVAFVVYGYRPVSANGEREEQLLQIRPVILVMSVCQGNRGFPWRFDLLLVYCPCTVTVVESLWHC